MQKCKKGAALLLAASMMTFLLAGCGSNQVTTENTAARTTDLIAGFRISFLFWSWRFFEEVESTEGGRNPYDKGQR